MVRLRDGGDNDRTAPQNSSSCSTRILPPTVVSAATVPAAAAAATAVSPPVKMEIEEKKDNLKLPAALDVPGEFLNIVRTIDKDITCLHVTIYHHTMPLCCNL